MVVAYRPVTIAFAAAAVLLSALVCAPVGADDEDISLTDTVDRLDLDFYWDPYSESGLLQRGNVSVRFVTRFGRSVVSYQDTVTHGGVTRREGELFIPATFQRYLEELFPPPEERFERTIAAIYIDAGHGGRDPGAIGVLPSANGPVQITEKSLALDVAVQLGTLLERRFPAKEIVLSRSEDVYLTLEERTVIANGIDIERNETVIFVSVHANASLNSAARGFEVWFLPPEVRRANLVTADRVGVDDPAVLSIINTIREEEITLESVLLARNVLAGMDAAIGGESPNRGVKEESWYVVRNAKMPSILVEIGFVTNPDELALLTNAEYLSRLVDGIFDGIVSFVENFEQVGTDE